MNAGAGFPYNGTVPTSTVLNGVKAPNSFGRLGPNDERIDTGLDPGVILFFFRTTE